MKISVDFSGLTRLAEQMGSYANFVLPESKVKFEPIDDSLRRGAKIEPGKYAVKGGILPSYDGRQVVLYIKDHSYINGGISNFDLAMSDGGKGNKVHIANCSTLESMNAQGRYDRYVVCNNITGAFEIAASGGRSGEAELHVCKNCLNLLNYQGCRDSAQKRNQHAANFDYNEFFKTYSSFFRRIPKGMADDDVGYTADWGAISQRLRERSGYVCSDCRVDLKSQKNLCHVHHINGVKNDNSAANLEVLCADCHRKKHDTHLYVSHQDTQTINRLRKEQNRIPGGWSEALKLADPAVHGELLILQGQGYSAPEIGYEVVGADGAVIAELEAAWPSRKECLIIDEELDARLLRGWKVRRLGDIARL